MLATNLFLIEYIFTFVFLRLALSVSRLLVFPPEPPSDRPGPPALPASAGSPPHVPGGDITITSLDVTLIIITNVSLIIITNASLIIVTDVSLRARGDGQSSVLSAVEKQ